MSSPQISFRLSAYQLARGLKIIRAIEPEHIPTSLSQLVKTIYLDYLAKTSLNKDDVVSEANIAEIYNLINSRSATMSLADFQQATNDASTDEVIASYMSISRESVEKEKTESKVTSVSDFSPPSDWLKE